MSRTKKKRPASEQYWIGYCRKSTDTEDKQIYTLNDQAAMIEEYYKRLPAAERSPYPLRLLQEARSAYHPGRAEKPLPQAISRDQRRSIY